MLRGIFVKVNKIFTPQPKIQLGRWSLKHNSNDWQNYLSNYYGDPGYTNLNKDIWIKKLKNFKN